MHSFCLLIKYLSSMSLKARSGAIRATTCSPCLGQARREFLSTEWHMSSIMKHYVHSMLANASGTSHAAPPLAPAIRPQLVVVVAVDVSLRITVSSLSSTPSSSMRMAASSSSSSSSETLSATSAYATCSSRTCSPLADAVVAEMVDWKLIGRGRGANKSPYIKIKIL